MIVCSAVAVTAVAISVPLFLGPRGRIGPRPVTASDGSETKKSPPPPTSRTISERSPTAKPARRSIDRLPPKKRHAQESGGIGDADVSADGRYVVFHAWSKLTADAPQSSGKGRVYLRDRAAGHTIFVSRPLRGDGDVSAGFPTISGDGRTVAYLEDDVEGLVPQEELVIWDRVRAAARKVDLPGTAGRVRLSFDGRYAAVEVSDVRTESGEWCPLWKCADIFLADTSTGVARRVSVSALGTRGNGASIHPSISSDGRYVAFESLASNLAAHDTNATSDVFVYDADAQRTERVSVGADGTESDGSSRDPSLSGNGRYVAYVSEASNFRLVPPCRGSSAAVYVRDLETGSVASPWRGAACEPTGDHPSLSEEGNRLAFRTGPGTAWLWERGSGTPDRILDCGYPLSVDLSGDGRSLLIASGCALVAGAATHDDSMEAYVRDLATGKVDEVSIADAPA